MSKFQDEKLLEKFKITASLYNFKNAVSNEKTNKTFKPQKGLFERYGRTQIAFFILLIFVTSGIVFAKNYKNLINSFMMGSGIDNAIDNRYIETVNMEYENSNVIISNDEGAYILDNSNIGIKVVDFLIDDTNLSTHFDIKLDEKIQNIIDINEITQIEINNITILDEKNNKINEVGCGINYFIEEKNKDYDTISYTYNLYTNNKFPNSKKLYYEIKNLTIKDKQKSIYLDGKWKFSLSIPEEMVQRTSIEYEVVDCDNKDFNVYTAKVTNTGFEIGITINNVKTLENPLDKLETFKEELNEKYENGEISLDELNRLYKEREDAENVSEQYSEYLLSRIPIKIDNDYEKQGKTINDTSYVENENGNKYLCTMSPSRRSNQNFISDNVLDFYETFGLTKHETTKYITVRLMYNDNPVTIHLKQK